MTIGEAVRSVLVRNYATFDGRASRSEYWWWYLVWSLVATVTGWLVFVAGSGLLVGWGLIVAGGLIPTLAVGSRRLHDIGRSGWWQLVGLVPGIGGIVLLIYLTEGSGPENEYGSEPDGPDRAARGDERLRSGGPER